jgi:hypothetical protein
LRPAFVIDVLDVIDDIVISLSEKQDKEMAEAHVP